MKNNMLREKSNASGNNVNENDDGEGAEEARNEPQPQVSNNRRRNARDDKHGTAPGQIVCSNPSVSKSEAIRVLDLNKRF